MLCCLSYRACRISIPLFFSSRSRHTRCYRDWSSDVCSSDLPGANGLGLERYNWAVGMTVTFPLFDFASLHARKQIEAANERREAARYDQAVQDLTGQLEKARAAWEGARRIAENTSVQLTAARATESQSRARYQAGLATIVEVADAQRLLIQAETDDSLARLSIWRWLFVMSAAEGDLEAFLRLARGTAPGGPYTKRLIPPPRRRQFSVRC